MTNSSSGLKPIQNNKKPYKGAVHTPESSKGLGDYYGSGIPAKIGKIRSNSVGVQDFTPQKLNSPPRSLA